MTATKSPAAAHATARIPELDGLRGVAILTVVSLHYLWARIPLPSSGPGRYAVRFGLTGWAGVDLFFVLSGFLIGGIVLNARQSGRYYSTFYARRICRIFPLYFALLALTAIAALTGPEWMHPLAGRTNVPWLAYATFTQNVWMASGATFGAIALAATWSLAIEEQFYVLLPVIVRRLEERGLVVLLAAIIVGTPLLRREMVNRDLAHVAIYVLLPSRADALAWGVLAAVLLRRERLRTWIAERTGVFLGFFAVSAIGIVWFAETSSELSRAMLFFGYTWIAMSAALTIIIGVTQPDSPVSRVLRTRMLRGWGEIAYGVYLIHPTVYWLLLQTHVHQAIVTIAAVAMTWFLAHASWRWFESPIIRVGRRWDYLRPPAPVHEHVSAPIGGAKTITVRRVCVETAILM